MISVDVMLWYVHDVMGGGMALRWVLVCSHWSW